MIIHLPARPPFSLFSAIYSHGWYQLAPFSADGKIPSFHYIDHLASGRVVEYQVSEAGEGQTGANLTTENLSTEEAQEVTSKITWMLGLNQDFSSFYEVAQGEPKLAQAARKAAGRILRSPTIFEDILKTLLTTNTMWSATIRMNKNVVSQFGLPLPGDPERKAFPKPEHLAQTTEQVLREQTRLGYRAPYVLALAQRTASGEIDLESLKDPGLTTEETRKRLLQIKGLGPYAAANLLMLLGHYDYIPVDSWALKVVSIEWYGGEPVTKKEVEAAFERWGKWKGLAYWLWDWNYKWEGGPTQ